MEKVLKVIVERYSEQQLTKAQDIICDLRDEAHEAGFRANAQALDSVFHMLTDAINLDA
jgi:hypothetical protein